MDHVQQSWIYRARVKIHFALSFPREMDIYMPKVYQKYLAVPLVSQRKGERQSPLGVLRGLDARPEKSCYKGHYWDH